MSKLQWRLGGKHRDKEGRIVEIVEHDPDDHTLKWRGNDARWYCDDGSLYPGISVTCLIEEVPETRYHLPNGASTTDPIEAFHEWCNYNKGSHCYMTGCQPPDTPTEAVSKRCMTLNIELDELRERLAALEEKVDYFHP